jgi:hypothetical protein
VKKPNLVQSQTGVYNYPAVVHPPMTSVPFTAGNAPVRSVPNLQPSAPAPAMGKVQQNYVGTMPTPPAGK